ncbi:NUDIX domain-containing protein [Corynebacterium sp. HMSC071B10]|uniref:NUDIX hydrolase n=1 Tax=Corynebacterium sp. HMSC071B10 TaxID=1739494 RepID=UPI0008A426B0|nr:NUDIX domain-containing protein [Corynebacterium sp. HMSC071B10]OFP36726.1 NUDIX hydrolase [Corynebacterium sp. HMSC071B10]
MQRSVGAFSADRGDEIDVTEVSGFHGARMSATVLLLRDTPQGMEVWMQERVLSMKNYPGVTVFPGGGVDSRDFPGRAWNDGDLWLGRSAISMARQLGVTKYKAHALVFAAVRELFEETGTLLAVDDAGQLLDDARPFHHQRLLLESHEISLTDVLRAHDLNVCADLLKPFARWVGQSERGNWFDTFSFLAANPTGQEPDGNTGEADDANWFPPSLLLEGWRHGLVRFAPATWAQLRLIEGFNTVEETLESAKHATISPVIGDPVDDERFAEFFTFTPKDRIGRRYGISPD